MHATIDASQEDDLRERALGLLRSSHSYNEVAALVGVSRGKVWRWAVAAGARKHEARIQSRHEKRALQLAVLEEIANETVTSDVLDFMNGLPDECATAIISSPPYNIGRSYEGHGDKLRHVYYVGWMTMVISEVARVLKPGGTVALEVGVTKRDDGTRVPLQKIFHGILEDAGLTWQNTVSWVAPHGREPDWRLCDRHEDILIFTKGKPRILNKSAARAPKESRKACIEGTEQR